MEGTYRGREIGQWAKFAIFTIFNPSNATWVIYVWSETLPASIFETDFSFSYGIFADLLRACNGKKIRSQHTRFRKYACSQRVNIYSDSLRYSGINCRLFLCVHYACCMKYFEILSSLFRVTSIWFCVDTDNFCEILYSVWTLFSWKYCLIICHLRTWTFLNPWNLSSFNYSKRLSKRNVSHRWPSQWTC